MSAERFGFDTEDASSVSFAAAAGASASYKMNDQDACTQPDHKHARHAHRYKPSAKRKDLAGSMAFKETLLGNARTGP